MLKVDCYKSITVNMISNGGNRFAKSANADDWTLKRNQIFLEWNDEGVYVNTLFCHSCTRRLLQIIFYAFRKQHTHTAYKCTHIHICTYIHTYIYHACWNLNFKGAISITISRKHFSNNTILIGRCSFFKKINIRIQKW